MLSALQNFFWWSIEKIQQFFQWLTWWVYDLFLGLAEAAIDLVDVPQELFTSFMQWADLPPQVQYILTQIGIMQCVALLLTAISVRFALNLIPGIFTRI